MDFIDIKNAYNQTRKVERDDIAKYFNKQEDFENEKPAARAGRKNYKSGGRLLKEYDLSNWNWVCVKRNKVKFFISLQTFDRDPNTGNLHVLMDRIGIYAYVGECSSVNAQTKMMMTNIELPMNDEKMNQLCNTLRDLSECEVYRIQGQYEEICSKHNLA